MNPNCGPKFVPDLTERNLTKFADLALGIADPRDGVAIGAFVRLTPETSECRDATSSAYLKRVSWHERMFLCWPDRLLLSGRQT